MELSFETMIAGYPNEVKENAKLSRDLIFKLFSQIEELPEETSIKYSFGKGPKNVLCSIIPSQKILKIDFYKGSELNDPECLLHSSSGGNKYLLIKDFYNQQHYLRYLFKEAFKMWQMR